MIKYPLKFISKKKGFTLIELVISIAIASIIFLLISFLFSETLNSMKINSKSINRANDSYLFFENLRSEIEGADYINENRNNNTLGFYIVQFNTSDESKYTYYTFENGSIYRNTQNSKIDYIGKSKIFGKKGKNKIIEDIDSVNVMMDSSKINITIIINNIKYRRTYAIRTDNI